MIEFTRGDLFSADVDIRVNTVNCVGVMGAGVALAFKTHYPDMFKEYKRACDEGRVAPGSLHIWKNILGDWVVNFPTKRNWRDPSQYDDISVGLDALRAYLVDQGGVSVALPALGCGHGGLDWHRVSTMIAEKLADLEAKILVYEPADSIAAGRRAKTISNGDEDRALASLGFGVIRLQNGSSPDTEVYASGEPGQLTREWIALLPSKNPTDRERLALKEIARSLAQSPQQQPVALLYANQGSESIASIFLAENVAIVLILPFSPLARKSIGQLKTRVTSPHLSMLTITNQRSGGSKQTWLQSTELLRVRSRAAIISDPEPKWLDIRSAKAWGTRPLLYLRSKTFQTEVRAALDEVGARAIDRNPDTGIPDLAPITTTITGLNVKRQGRDCDQSHVFSSANVSPNQLREIADVLEKVPGAGISISFDFSPSRNAQELCEAIAGVLGEPAHGPF